MSLETIATLLRQRIGLDPKIMGDRTLARAVEIRRVACQLPTVAAYRDRLQTSAAEFDELVEQIVVPETSFFRDRKPFDFLVNWVHSANGRPVGATKLRVLSAPCSTGEEPYSIAIALLEAGLSPPQFSIDAIDISRVALAKANRAIYGKNSFRGADWVERSRYFLPVTDQGDQKYAVSPVVRQAVNFRQGNLLEVFTPAQSNRLPNSPPKYDIIFCRNLLIYLEPMICQRLLFVGSAETSKVPSDRFTFLRQSLTFAYRKIALEPTLAAGLAMASPFRVQSARQPTASSQPPLTATQGLAQRSKPKPMVVKPAPSPSAVPMLAPDPAQRAVATQPDPARVISLAADLEFQQAQQLADAGQLELAIQACQTYLKSCATDVKAYTLLGTLYQATANYAQAERYFQKALYLQPNDYEALMHLALLKAAQGDATGAARLHQRLQKL
jgi:chemotaxis protein methyltransferase WspC